LRRFPWKNPRSKFVFKEIAGDFGGRRKKSDWISGGNKILKPVTKAN
jgi:hypothetical protein